LFDNHKYGKKTILLINLFLFQAFCAILSAFIIWARVNNRVQIPIGLFSVVNIVVAIVIALGSFWLLMVIIRLAEKERETERQAIHLQESKQMIDVLRTHRHDFMNHIQIIYTLAQMGKTDILAEYVGNLKGNVEAEAKLSKLAQPELAAFIIKKISSAADTDVKLWVDVETSLAEIKMPLNEMVSILGNLLDNAIYAADYRQSGEKRVQLKLAEDEQRYIISVCNNGPEISAELRESIFEKGFTTKGEGSGYGLHIVRTIVEQHDGTIRLAEAEGFSTCFEVILPKKTH
jgi:sensor histidine kinase regulating citrate/malate metabolism